MVFFFIPVIILVFFIYKFIFKKKTNPLENKHIIITGGSSGIGKAFAIEAAKKGAKITLLARDAQKLEHAKNEIEKHCLNSENQRVQYITCDVSESYDAVEKAINSAEMDLGPTYMLVNCAGMAICGRLEDTSPSDIKYLFDLNYMGTVFAVKAVLPKMKCQGEGRIVIVGSQASLIGIYGYTAYSSTKFALRGLAEALHMETRPYNISVTLSLPPDTDTPGFANEEKTKPIETKMISKTAGLTSPETVAVQLIKDTMDGKFFSTVGFESYMLETLCAGMSPVYSIEELINEVIFMGIFRIIGVMYLWSFHRIIKKCRKTRDQNKKSE